MTKKQYLEFLCKAFNQYSKISDEYHKALLTISMYKDNFNLFKNNAEKDIKNKTNKLLLDFINIVETLKDKNEINACMNSMNLKYSNISKGEEINYQRFKVIEIRDLGLKVDSVILDEVTHNNEIIRKASVISN